MSELDDLLTAVGPADAAAAEAARARQDRLTKPRGSLGVLEALSVQLAGLCGQVPPPVPEPAAVAVFAGDHGVYARGVSPWPQEVTGQMVDSFLAGGAVLNTLARRAGVTVQVVDVGTVRAGAAPDGLLDRRIRAGTADLATGPAMSRDEAVGALIAGAAVARDLVASGHRCLLTGDMGIGNTTASATLIAVFTASDPAEVTGPGAGSDAAGLNRKIDAIRTALDLHRPDPADPIGVLATVGGLEHAALVGYLLAGAGARVPVVLDGVTPGAAALVARAVAPDVTDALVAGHRSTEPGATRALDALGLRPVLDLGLRLGEGSGALLALPIVQAAAAVLGEVATFPEAGVSEGDP